ncbi:hypothetical protein ACEWY4_020220 [Coilia grayii]|uniref:Uncharacterized protein n=1 Tax=Coilia grayii TaxID=363190 RepID=A0ABD1JCA3_9TELE
MASALSEEILCSVCLCEFNDPVSLRCQHSFCRKCITAHLATSGGTGQCPECRHPFGKKHIKANRTLQKVVSAAKEHLQEQKTLETLQESLTSILFETETQPPQRREDATLMCPLHEEKLKLFCEVDQQLLCVVCRDGIQHEGHKCRPAEEVEQRCKAVLSGAVAFLSKENQYLDYMISLQTAEILRTQERSRELSLKISSQFAQLQQLLRQQEQKVLSRLQQEEARVLGPMQTNLSKMTQLAAKDRNTEWLLQSNLSNAQPITFLQWWTSTGHDMVEELLVPDEESAEGQGSLTDQQFLSKLTDLSVSSDVIELGPYETHLPFFVWKEVLKDIKKVPHDDVMAQWDEAYARVGRSGRSIQRADRKGVLGLYRDYRPLARGRAAHWHGRHYWEVEVGRKLDWGVGVCVESPPGQLQEQVMLYLKHGRGYSVVIAGSQETPLNPRGGRPWRVGVYLDCDAGRVSFYDTDSLVLIHTAEFGTAGLPLSLCLSPGCYIDGGDCDALTVCCYQPAPQGDLEFLAGIWRTMLRWDEAFWG